MIDNFTHLHLHTEYSLLDGVGKIDEYLSRAKDYGMDAMAVTDHGNMFCAIEFYKKAKKENIKPILGIEMYVAENNMKQKDGSNYHLVLLAKNNIGYKNLVKLTTLSYKEGFYRRPRVDKETLSKYKEGLIVLSACMHGEISQAILKFYPNLYDEKYILEKIKVYEDIYGKEDFYLEVQANEIPEQKYVNEVLFAIAKKYNYKLVATNDVHYLNKNDNELQDIVICIQTGARLKDEKRMHACDNLYFKSRQDMIDSLGEKYLEAINNTNEIKDKCNVELEFGKFQFPYYDVPKEYKNSQEYLRYLCIEGLNKLYKNISVELMDRLEYELNTINSMGYADYFIIVWDFINYAREKNIPIGPGRGSAAGSLVSYLLGITKIDPIKYKLIFERFLNPERISMPDIDIDICQERRQEIIDYVRNKYGNDHVAHIITFGTLKARAAVRDVGRVMDVPLYKVDKFTKILDRNASLKENLKNNAEIQNIYATDLEMRKVIDYSVRIENKVRNASTHAAGILITKQPLYDIVPIYLDNKENLQATQYQMKELEDLGLLKMDFLGLRNLTIVQRCIDYIKASQKIEIDVYSLPLDDEKVYKMLSEGDTLGVFQMEAVGFRNLLKKLKPNKFEDIIAMLSLYRPGPLQSGMVDKFLNCKHGKEKITYPHESLESILKETYGVILYQEQVIKIANVMANYTLGEADNLRRAMGKKNFEIMNANKEKFVNGALANGYDENVANSVFELIYHFAGYGFNKSHSAAYAYVSYLTAYFKVNYPTYYYAALMTSDMANIDNIAIYFNDAKAKGISILAPDINRPSTLFQVQNDAILFSLTAIKNVGYNVAEGIVKEWKANGDFKDFYDFYSRTKKIGVNKKTLEALIYAGALDSLPANRKEKISSIDSLLAIVAKKSEKDDIQQLNLFGNMQAKISETFIIGSKEDFTDEEKIRQELEFLGFFVSKHPLDKYKNYTDILSLEKISDISLEEHKNYVLYGIVRNVKKIITKKNQTMASFDLECYGNNLRCISYPRVYEENLDVFIEGNEVVLEGKISIDEFKGNKNTNFVVNKIKTFKELLPSKACMIYILIDEEDKYKYFKMKTFFENNKGTNNILFAYIENETKKTKKTNIYTNITFQMLDALIDLIGSNKIKLKRYL